ncbi:MAG: hypothetical protein JXQ89_15230 [Pelagimonas sp.]
MRQIMIGCALVATLAGCSNPLQDIPKLSDVEVPQQVGQADIAAQPEASDVPILDAATASDVPLDGADSGDLELVAVPSERALVAEPRRGLLGFFGRKADGVTEQTALAVEPVKALDVTGDESVAEADLAQSVEAEIQLAAMIPQEPVDATPAAKPRGVFGLLGGGGAKAKALNGPKPGDPDYDMVGADQRVPYGEIARACDVSRSDMGQKSETYKQLGKAFALYDTAPETTQQRSFYMTGFADGCPRKFSAALVMFSSPETYEAIHYSSAGATQPTSETDRAYEKIKSKVCRVRKGKPCGSKMKTLARNTVFMSVYERFGNSPRWKTFLLHDGAVVAVDVKG